jgi:hypothetical protein
MNKKDTTSVSKQNVPELSYTEIQRQNRDLQAAIAENKS